MGVVQQESDKQSLVHVYIEPNYFYASPNAVVADAWWIRKKSRRHDRVYPIDSLKFNFLFYLRLGRPSLKQIIE